MKTTDTGARGDFLSTVIDRAHERAPLVAPRPASLFEPVAASIAEASGSNESFASPRTSTHPDAPPAHEPLPRIASPRAAEPARDAPRLAPVHVMPQIAHTQHFHITAEAPSPRAQPAAAAPALALPAAVPHLAPTRADAAAPAPRASHEAMPESRRDNAVVPHIDVPSPQVAALLPNRDIVAAFVAHTPSLAAPSREAAAAATAPSAPVVTISIGRVDVRAPAAPPAAVRAPGTPRPAALSDYLGRKERAR